MELHGLLRGDRLELGLLVDLPCIDLELIERSLEASLDFCVSILFQKLLRSGLARILSTCRVHRPVLDREHALDAAGLEFFEPGAGQPVRRPS